MSRADDHRREYRARVERMIRVGTSYGRHEKRQGIEHMADADALLEARTFIRGINLNRWSPEIRDRVRFLREETADLARAMWREREAKRPNPKAGKR